MEDELMEKEEERLMVAWREGCLLNGGDLAMVVSMEDDGKK